MTHASLNIILGEHRALSAMARSITLLLSVHRRQDTLPDFDALRAMLFYVDEFPEKLHHPKESQLLFPKLRGRDPEIDAILDRLDRDHLQGGRAIREVEHALLGFEVMAQTNQRETRRGAFEAAMNRYVNSYLEHMHVEESRILPFAETVLTANDWGELDAAFLTNRDPLMGYEPDETYRSLFTMIVDTLRHSGAVGEALEAFAGISSPRFSLHR